MYYLYDKEIKRKEIISLTEQKGFNNFKLRNFTMVGDEYNHLLYFDNLCVNIQLITDCQNHQEVYSQTNIFYH